MEDIHFHWIADNLSGKGFRLFPWRKKRVRDQRNRVQENCTIDVERSDFLETNFGFEQVPIKQTQIFVFGYVWWKEKNNFFKLNDSLSTEMIRK